MSTGSSTGLRSDTVGAASSRFREPNAPSLETEAKVADVRRAREMVDTDGHDGWIHAELLGEVFPDSDGDEDRDADAV